MKLRIVSGDLGGRFLPVPKPASGFRPTAERTRESVANKIRSRIPGARVADLCAGSGAFGFEMLSSGAQDVDFVEKNRLRAGLIEKLGNGLGVAERMCVYREDVRRFAQRSSGPYDIIYFDPPYDAEHLQRVVEDLGSILSNSGVVIYERRSGVSRPWGMISPTEMREYGGTVVEFFEKERFTEEDAQRE